MSGPATAPRPASAGTPDRILEVARQLFHRRGFADVGINDICTTAGVAKGSFYHFFPSKQALLEAVIKHNADAIIGDLNRRSRNAPNGRQAVLAHFEDLVDQAREDCGRETVLGCAVGTLASEMSASNEGARTEAQRAFLRWQMALAGAIRAGIGDGSIARSVDPESTALTLLGLIQGMSTLGRVSNDPDRLQAMGQLALKRLLPVGGSG